MDQDHTSVPDDTSPADRLIATLRGYGRTLVAFSGGVDSSVVLAAAARAGRAGGAGGAGGTGGTGGTGGGTGGVAAVTAVSPALPESELADARAFCAELGVRHHTVTTGELEVAGYRDNGPRRCYFCKSTLLDEAVALARAEGFAAVATGTNASDVAGGFRPGIRAAAERGARTPLADLGLDKAAVRDIARGWGLRTWDKPAAACLSSRIAYGVGITPARLARVERAEAALRPLLADHGVRDLRVRDLGEAVRVEVNEPAVASVRDDPAVAAAVADAGFGRAPLAVEPFRSGSMNELLTDREHWRRA